MQIIQNKLLKFPLKNKFSDPLLKNIAKSDRVGGEILLNWEYEEAARATYFLDDFRPDPLIPEIPSPIIRDYNFPCIFPAVFEHQKVCAGFLSLRSRCFNFSEAGTGKSASAIWAADYLMHMGLVKRVLIIAPLSILYTAWYADIFKTAMHRTAGVIYGDKKARQKILAANYDFNIINYDGIGVIFPEIESARFDLIIVDEANAYKRATTKRWKTLAKLINPSTRLWMMTGTPAAQSPMDAFGLGKLISPERIPKFATAWRDKVMWSVTRFKWEPKLDAKQKVFEALQPAIRFTKKECLDLPDVMYETRQVALSPQAGMYYKKLKNQMLIEAAGEEISAVNAAAKLNKLLQIAQGAVYTDDKDVVEFDISPRLTVLKEVLDECGEKAIIFVPFLHTIEVVRDFLNVTGYSNDVICGSVSGKARSEIINRFQQDTNPQVLIIQPQAASHGVTLTAASTIVFWGPVLSVETRIQAIGRIDRVGQVNKMLVVDLIGSDVERKVLDMTMGKLEEHESLVELYKQEIGFNSEGYKRV